MTYMNNFKDVPDELTQTVYVSLLPWSATPWISSVAPSTMGEVLLAEVEVTIPIDTSQDFPALLHRKKLGDLEYKMAVAVATVTEVQGQIDELKALTYQG